MFINQHQIIAATRTSVLKVFVFPCTYASPSRGYASTTIFRLASAVTFTGGRSSERDCGAPGDGGWEAEISLPPLPSSVRGDGEVVRSLRRHRPNSFEMPTDTSNQVPDTHLTKAPNEKWGVKYNQMHSS